MGGVLKPAVKTAGFGVWSAWMLRFGVELIRIR
jgi:hypothetical protein